MRGSLEDVKETNSYEIPLNLYLPFSMDKCKQRLISINKEVEDGNTNGLIQLRRGRVEIGMDKKCVMGRYNC